MEIDPYKTLGVAPETEDVVIKGAYNALLKKYHPDVFKGDKKFADRKTKELNAAYAIISSPEKRAKYDARHKPSAANAQPNGAASASATSDADKKTENPISPNQQSSSLRWGWVFASIIFAIIAVIKAALDGQHSSYQVPAPAIPSLDFASGSAWQPKGNTDKPKPEVELSEHYVSPVKIDWSAKENGDPKTYKVGDYTVRISSHQTRESVTPIPTINLSAENLPQLDFVGQAGFETAAATVEVIKIDPKEPHDEIIFLTSSGGAHCCTQIDIFEPRNKAWRHISLGDWDGDVLNDLPKDVDGDGIPDIILRDGSFNYTFASYAASYPPPLVFNLMRGTATDVSSDRRFADLFRNEMIRDHAACLLHQNGACASFVAIATRLGLHDWAWQIMLANFQPSSEWQYPTKCDLDTNGLRCPADHQVATTFPEALGIFLSESKYRSEFDSSEANVPSFNCSHVTSEVLRLVCHTPALSELDRNLAAAYYAATENNSGASFIKSDQLDWIHVRNNLPPDADKLQQLYAERYAYLLGIAQRRPQ